MDLLYRWTHAGIADPVLEAFGRSFLIHGTGPWLLVLLALTLAAWLPRLRDLARLGEGLSRSALLAFGMVFLGGALLRLWWAPHSPQVFFDEFNFLEAGRGLALDGHYLVPRPHDEGRLVPIPPAWSFWLSLAFRVTGPTYGAVLFEALALAILSLPLAFLVGWLLFGRPVPAVALALFLAVLPVHLRMSGSAALETGSFFWLLLTWVAVLAWQRERRPAWLYAAGTAAAWMMNWRMENPFAILPVLGLAAILLDPQPLRTLRCRHLYLALAGAFALAAPGIVADLYGLGSDFYLFYGSEADRLEQVRQNVGNNLRYWFDGRIHPLEITVLAGLGVAWWRPFRRPLAWLSWTVLLHAFYTMTPSADFGLHHTLDSWRNALQPALGLMVLAAAGCEALHSWLSAPVPRRLLKPSLALLALAFLALPLRSGAFVHARHVWLQEFRLLQEATRRLPPGAHLLLDGKPEHLGDLDLRVATLGYATTREWKPVILARDAFRRPGAGEPPRLLQDVQNWNVAGERVFLYYFGRKGSAWDYYRRLWLQDHLRLRLVAGMANPLSECTFTLYEVDGLGAPGRRWLERPAGPAGGGT